MMTAVVADQVESDYLQLIQNFRRRTFIKILKDLGGEAHIREVVRRIAKFEGKENDRRVIKSIHVSLLQTHIPRLERAGIISYHNGVIKLIELPPELEYYIEIVERGDIPWCIYYMVSSFVALIVSIILQNLPAAIIVSSFLVASHIHVFQTYDIKFLLHKSFKRFLTLIRR